MRIGDWQIVPERNLLRSGSKEVRLRRRAMDVLVYLAARPGLVVPVPELIAALWRAEVSAPNALHKVVVELRKALGDDAERPRYIESVPRRGYRLVAPVAFEQSIRLAVAQFDGDEQTDFFRRGVRDAVLVRLGRIAKVSLVSLSAGTDGDHTLPTHVLRGASTCDDDTTRLVVSLTQLTDGATLYTDHFDRVGHGSLTDHDLLGRRIADVVSVHVDPSTRAHMGTLGTRDAEAYLALCEAQHLYELANYQALVRAVARLREAIARDPEFLLAYARLAVSLRFLHWYEGTEDLVRELDDLSLAVSARAPGSETARMVAATRSCVGGQIGQQEAQLFDLLNSGDASAEAFRLYGRLLAGAGLWAEASCYLERAQTLAPNEIVWEREAGEVVLLRDGLEASVEYRKRYLVRDPGDIGHLAGVVMGLARLGHGFQAEEYLSHMRRYDEIGNWSHSADYFMRAILGRLRLGSPEMDAFVADPKSSDIAIGMVYFILGDTDGGIRHWRRLDGYQLNVMSINRPGFDILFPESVLADPRYPALLDEIGLGTEWRRFLEQRVLSLAARTGLLPADPIRA